MDQFLTEEDARVLGSLIEKQITTPDNYPLSLNALVNACNQSTNRHPVVSYDEDTVLAALARLRRASLVRGMQRIDARVTKYEHVAPEILDVDANELGILCVLLLRGPNTVGELRTRTERLAKFESLGDVEAALTRLIERAKEPLVVRLPRRAGQKEVRYAHLLSGAVSTEAGEADDVMSNSPVEAPFAQAASKYLAETAAAEAVRAQALETKVLELQNELDDLRRQFAEFRKQFE